MIRNMLPYFEEGGAFVAVGFSHLSGILEKLKAQGYEARTYRIFHTFNRGLLVLMIPSFQAELLPHPPLDTENLERPPL